MDTGQQAVQGINLNPTLEYRCDPFASQVLFESDMRSQQVWLSGHAVRFGYRGAEELLRCRPELFTRLAARWRRQHPLSNVTHHSDARGGGW